MIIQKMYAGGNIMGIVLWIVLGAAAGWLASIVMGKNRGMGWLANIIVGVIGAALGGWISSWLLEST